MAKTRGTYSSTRGQPVRDQSLPAQKSQDTLLERLRAGGLVVVVAKL